MDFSQTLPTYLKEKGETASIHEVKEYPDHVAVILADFRKLVIPKDKLLTIHNAAATVEIIAETVADLAHTIADATANTTTNDDAPDEKPAPRKRGKK
ncbi:MAG: hypothetical protein E6Q97_23090 [Desulfurellales bacterium]|nr:MAG: hypothetical protein E6Q97_23090 [Desulfurellales bacterium]